MRQVPGVTAAAFTSQLPLSGDLAVYGMQFESRPNDNSEGLLQYAVSPGYFDTMGIPLRAGRPARRTRPRRRTQRGSDQ